MDKFIALFVFLKDRQLSTRKEKKRCGGEEREGC